MVKNRLLDGRNDVYPDPGAVCTEGEMPAIDQHKQVLAIQNVAKQRGVTHAPGFQPSIFAAKFGVHRLDQRPQSYKVREEFVKQIFFSLFFKGIHVCL